MKSTNNNLVKKEGRASAEGIIVKFIEIASSSIKWIIRYSGLEFIYRKFYPSKNPHPLPNGFIWLIGIYVAFFGVASQRYEDRRDIIENRANSIFDQLATDAYKKAFGRISTVQNMRCPKKPDILNPITVFRSIFVVHPIFKEAEDPLMDTLKKTIEEWKEKLDGVNLNNAHLNNARLNNADLSRAKLSGAKLDRAKLIRAKLSEADLSGASLRGAELRRADLHRADLTGADLSRADLRGADLRRADLSEAKLIGAGLIGANLSDAGLSEADLSRAFLREANLSEADLSGAEKLTANQLCEAKTLYLASLRPEIKKQIEEKCPELLKEPKRKNADG